MNYSNEIKKSMLMLSKNSKSIFRPVCCCTWKSSFKSLELVPPRKKLELPVFEETQMGMAIGLSLDGFIPITCYPRFDFFILSMNQTINHLDKLYQISSNEFNPFVIIRVLVGGKKGINAGPQHTGNYTSAMKKMVKFLNVVELKSSAQIYKSYKNCISKKKSTLFVEYSDLYK